MAFEGPKIALHTLTHTHTHTGVIVQLESKILRTHNMDGQMRERRGKAEGIQSGSEGTSGTQSKKNRTSDEWWCLHMSQHSLLHFCPSREQTDVFSRKLKGGACLGVDVLLGCSL